MKLFGNILFVNKRYLLSCSINCCLFLNNTTPSYTCSCAFKFFKRPKCGSQNETTEKRKKKIGAHSLIRSTLGVGGHTRALDGTRTNSQAKVQNEVNMHN